jgi:hypothetical protein
MSFSTYDWQKTYPTVVSRTLDPSGKNLVTIVGMHDRQITDADINLIQDLQDYKRQRLLDDQVTSGCLTYTPFQFAPLVSNTFYVPSFDILFNGEVITIQGSNSSALTLNAVSPPVPPPVWSPGTLEEDARLYIAFVEVWYQSLNPQTGQGYYTDPITGLRYFYPYGGVNPVSTNATLAAFLDDSVDPFQGLFTTERAQIQWRISVQRVGLNYDFTQFQFGLDPSTATNPYAPMAVYPQAGQSAPVTAYTYANMGSINGDTGVWRAGDGNVFNSLGTMDGYSYAFPLATIFVKNSGNFDIVNNLWGSGNSNPPAYWTASPFGTNGLLSSGISGRFDNRLADQIFQDNVVDTRSTVNLSGWDMDALCRYGFGDLVQGETQLAISRGDATVSPTNAENAGSRLNYYVAVAPTGIINTNTIGAWDGFSNGFSSDLRTFTSTIAVSTSNKSLGNNGQPWVSGPPQGDAFTITLPASSQATIQSVAVTALVTNSPTTVTPAALLKGQVTITGLGSKSVTVQLTDALSGTAFDPGANPIYATIGVQYPAGSSGLVHVPYVIDGGQLFDNSTGVTMPVYGVSEYEVQSSQLALQALQVLAINPEYSDTVLGTRIQVLVPGSSGIPQTLGSQAYTQFIIPRIDLNESVNGLYGVTAWDSQVGQGTLYPISSRVLSGNNYLLTIQKAVPTSSTMVVEFIAQDTAQLAYNAPVKGVTEIEETVLFGNYSGPFFNIDQRVQVVSIGYNAFPANTTTIVLAAQQPTITTLSTGCSIKGIAGDDAGNRFIWVSDGATPTPNFTAITIPATNITINNGVITLVVPGNYATSQFFFVGSILPAFDPLSRLIVEMHYIPYQGEGVLNRDYEFLHAEDNALITTNGTGAAPIVGLQDIYPYNRELPIAITMPSQPGWSDATLANAALETFFDSNFVAMRVNNVEHTFLAPMHTNDFIPPINKDIRKSVRFVAAATGGRGFGTAVPHLGFAIAPPTARTVLGVNLQATTAPITLYVNNVTGLDSNSGLSLSTAKLTISSAMNELPPVLSFPCVIELADTGVAYNVASIQSSGGLEEITLGNGVSESLFAFALANLSRVIQGEGRLVISIQSGASDQAVIDATGFSGAGTGPTYAFYTDTSRVIFNGILFKGFQGTAIKGRNADIQFVNCSWQDNLQAGSFEEACGVVIDGGTITMSNSGLGQMVGTGGTSISATGVNLAIDPLATNIAPFFVAERGSSLTLQTHGTTGLQESGFPVAPPFAIVALAELNSSVVVTANFVTQGSCVLEGNSVLAQTATTSFLGGVVADASSEIVTQL